MRRLTGNNDATCSQMRLSSQRVLTKSDIHTGEALSGSKQGSKG
jgi:hypothetical protein